MNNLTTSPVPGEKIKTMTFPDAIRQIIIGKKITKLEWKNEKVYGVLKDKFLMLHKEDGEFYRWIIGDGDLSGDDWIII